MNTRQLLRWLMTPARSGFSLSPADIQRLAAALGLRVAVFNRSMAIEQLLRGAALDGRLNQALAELARDMEAQLDAYRALDLPALAGWIARAEATLAAWSTISDEFEAEDQAVRPPS